MKKLIIIIGAGLILVGCNKFKDEVNTNTNLPSQATAAQLLANAMLSLPGLSSSPQGEFMAQYLAETQYVAASQYPEGSTSFYGWYQGPLMNIETVLNSSLTQNATANQLAVAKMLKAYYFWNITDRWGDVPFSEALKGSADFTPKYDTQESIYDELFKLLDEANAMVTAGSLPSDVIYAGDMTKWKKFGNTIHMLMALRLSEVSVGDKAKNEFNKAMNGGIMTANTDNFVFKHLADANNQNYWYGQVVNQNREWWALTKTLVDYMKPINDPRLPIFGKKNVSNDYVGLDFGTTVGIPNTTGVSLMGPAIYAQNANIYLVTYAQALFAKAEAAKRGWIPGADVEAKTNYDLAIDQSIRQWTGSNTGVATYMTQTGIPYDPANALAQISQQRYVHLFMHGYEAWSEWRRTGFPSNLVKPLGRNVPNRLGYPDNEAFNNALNYQDAVTRQFAGSNSQYGKVWWDKP
jgi:hypothetical protein